MKIFISTPVDLASIINLLMHSFMVHSNNGTANTALPAAESSVGSQEEDIFTCDYDSLHFDDLRLK